MNNQHVLCDGKEKAMKNVTQMFMQRNKKNVKRNRLLKEKGFTTKESSTQNTKVKQHKNRVFHNTWLHSKRAMALWFTPWR